MEKTLETLQPILDKVKGFFTSKEGIAITAGSLLALCAAKVYFSGGVCRVDRDLTNQIIVVTGGSAGLGKETIKSLANKGCTIIFGARDKIKSEKVVKEILEINPDCNIHFFPLDLADKKSIEFFSQRIKQTCGRIDILLNNAGVYQMQRKQTKDGFEMTMGTNYLGHFYLTYLLWDLIKSAQRPRVINVSSVAHNGWGRAVKEVPIDFQDMNYTKNFDGWFAYARSKVAAILFSRELQRRMDQSGIRGYALSLHPGAIYTQIFRNWGTYATLYKIFLWPTLLICFKNIHQGVQTHLYLILEDEKNLKKGEYYADCKATQSSAFSRNMMNAAQLWQISEKMLGIRFQI